MIRVALTAAVLIALSLCSAGGEPIDPLVRQEVDAGAHSLRLGLGYTPVGSTGTSVDAFGVPYEYTQLAHGLELSLAGELHVSPNHKLGIEVVHTSWRIRERRDYPQTIVDRRWRRRVLSYSAFAEARLAPGSELDPRGTLTLNDQGYAALDLSLSVLRDPMALFARIGYARRGETPRESISFALAAGFVANAWITLSTSAGWDVPLREAVLPATTLRLRVQYDLDMVGDLQLTSQVSLHLQEPKAVGVSLVLERSRS